MDSSDETRTTPVRSCPDCGARVQPGQRRCTNCGASVEQRRRLARRTPLVAALVVAALGGGAAVVAQAAVTDQATLDASAPADPASAPVQVAGNPLPAAEKPTSTAPKAPEVDVPANTSPTLEIPSLDSDVVGQANDERNDDTTSKDGENTDDDTKANPDDLGKEKKLKVKKADNYDPNLRVGVEFGEPKAAIDKRQRTVWDVNVPADGQEFGVGIVLDLGSTKRVSSLRIQTPTPKFGATIYRADVPDLPEKLEDAAWEEAATVKNVSDDVVVPLSDEPEWARYILLWLTTPRSDSDTRVALSNLEVLP
ncbi:MAG: zinc ribbon domain-containing protein [Solirubrobacteraceae bacterium]|nr:zinc ribbon domain-containing protein [Solirubrobacteraceae bacterium]